MIRLGINPIGWSNDDLPRLGGHIPLEQCLSEAKTAGFTGVELGNKFPREATRLAPILSAHGLQLVSGWYSTFLLERGVEAEFAAASAHAALLKAMGCSVFIAAECTGTVHSDPSKPLSMRPVLRDGDWERFAERLTALADLLAKDGLTLVYHHHMGTVVQTGPEVDRLMREAGDSVKLLLDTGHATWGGADPADLARRHKERIGHVHAKDVRPFMMEEARERDFSFLDAVVNGVYTVPGDGMIDFVGVFRELGRYAGWVVVEAEQDPEKAPPATYARMGHANVSRFLADAGLA